MSEEKKQLTLKELEAELEELMKIPEAKAYQDFIDQMLLGVDDHLERSKILTRMATANMRKVNDLLKEIRKESTFLKTFERKGLKQ